jgi:hypothetical protein
MRRKRETGRLLFGLALGVGLALATAEDAEAIKTIPVKVSAPTRDYSFTPVSVVVSEKVATSGVREMPKGVSATPCQAEPAGPGLVRLTFIADSMKKGESRSYELLPSGSGMRVNTRAVEIRPNGKNADILINGFLITRYDTTTGPNKPYFYPVNGPNGKSIVRKWPIEQNTGETKDHPHHRGIFFTHGLMNGADFWLETEGKASKTVHTGFDGMTSGPYYGHLRAKTDWITKEGKKIAEDTRDVRLYPVAGGYLMDFTIAVKAVGGPLVWGDTKEGTFGIRVADSMRAELERKEKEEGKVAQGKIVSSTGLKDAATWGKPAAWVDYYGPVEGETVGIAVFDDPKNPRHPTTWHVRTYGLFAVNPFGLHDFDPAKKNDPKAGEMTTAENETTTFRYILYVHRGTTEEARVADVYAAFAEPPTVELVAGQGGAR